MPRTLYVHAFCVADLDGDGRADFVADPQPRDAFSMTAYVLWNDLPAPLTRARAQVRDASLSAFALDTAADLDSANGLDLVVLAPVPFATSPGATVWLNQGGRLGFTALPQVVVAARSGTLADVDDDGLADLVLVNDVSATVVVMLSQGGGRFGAPITLTGTADGPPIVAHVSCDRRPDIIASDKAAGVVSVFCNQGGGDFAPGDARRRARGAGARVPSDATREGTAVAHPGENSRQPTSSTRREATGDLASLPSHVRRVASSASASAT